MAITPRLDLRQSQSLVMTPQLQQAIKLLQLSNIELLAYVEDELLRNPMLEREEGAAEGGDEAGSQESGGDRAEAGDDRPDDGFGDEAAGPDMVELAAADTLSSERDGPFDLDSEAVWTEDGPTERAEQPEQMSFDRAEAGSGGRTDFTEREGNLEATVSGEPTLREHLMEQLVVDLPDPIERMIGIQLIEALDEAGWLSEGLDQIAERLDSPIERVEKVLDVVQRFDPPGLFARTLKECLALQLRDRNRLDPAMQAMLDNLDLVARHDKAALLRVCGVDEEDLADMVVELRSLDPKPAQAFEHEVAQTVTPDIIMRPHPDGGWTVELNPETLPRVLVNVDYYARVRSGVRDRKEREYINDCFQSANWLVKSLHQRATTILKVATEIARQQDAFFRKGIEHMKPLVLRDIAEAIEMHESTVSRVTTNKFIHTPRGLFELKYFFSAAIGDLKGGTAHSAESVRFRIKALIDEEAPASILSDDRIVEILNREGIDIARRTVAKYREAMKIPSSVQRRRQKNQSF
jgi:RNA polymerase sigma-54 factor